MLLSMRPAEDKMTVKYEDRTGEGYVLSRFSVAASVDGTPIAPELIEEGGYVIPDDWGVRMISGPTSAKRWFNKGRGGVQEFTEVEMNDWGKYLSTDANGFLYLGGIMTKDGMSAGAWVVEVDYRDCMLAPDMTECRAVVADDGSGEVRYVPFDDAGNDLTMQVLEAKLAKLTAELEEERNKPAEVEVVEVPVEVAVEVPVEVEKEVVKEIEKAVPVEKEVRVTEYVPVAQGVDGKDAKIMALEQEVARLTGELEQKKAEFAVAGNVEVPETLQNCDKRDDKTMYWWAIIALLIGLGGVIAWWFFPVWRKKQERE